MAHRGPLREMFGMLCIAVLLPEVQESAVPTDRGLILDADEIPTYLIPPFAPVPVTPPVTGFMSFLISFLTDLFSVVGEELLNMVAMWFLNYALFPSLLVLECLFLRAVIRCGRVNRGDQTHNTNQTTSPEATTPGTHDIANGVAAEKMCPSTPTAGENGTADGDATEKTRHPIPSSSTERVYGTAEWGSTHITRQFKATAPAPPADDEDDDEWFDAQEWFDAEESLPYPGHFPDNTPNSPTNDQASVPSPGEIPDNTPNSPTNDQASVPSPGEIPDSTPSLPTNDQALADLQAELAEKASQILTLTEASEQNSDDIADLNRRNDSHNRLMETLRTSLDPQGLHTPTTDIVMLANQAAEKGKLLKQRTLAAESAARQAISQREYDIVRNQLTDVVEMLRQAREGSVDTQELQAERMRSQEVQATADEAVRAREQSESQLATARAELEVANDATANAESKALEKAREVEAAEKRARAAEETAAQNSAAANELREARDQAQEWRESNERLVLQLAQAEEWVKRNGTVSNEELIAQNNGLQAQLREIQQYQPNPEVNELQVSVDCLTSANQQLQTELDALKQQPSQAPVQATGPQIEERFQQGYQKAVQDCEQRAQSVIEAAVQREASEAAQRLATAVAQREQELEDSVQRQFQQQWDDREAQWSASLDAEVQTRAAAREAGLPQQLRDATRRAIAAEKRANEQEDELQEAQKHARDMHDSCTEKWNAAEAATTRAEAAEAKVKKYQQGKEAQDGRIKGLHEEIAALKPKVKAAAKEAAELKSLENENRRSLALIDEILNRSYDHTTRFVLRELIKANSKIKNFRDQIQKPTTKLGRAYYSNMLQNAEVGSEYLKLDDRLRCVLKKQCAAANAKVMALKEIISQSQAPDKDLLLEEVWKPRGDEEAEWNMLESESPPSSDEDENEDNARGTPGAVRARTPFPTARRNRPVQPAASGQADGQDSPMSDGPANVPTGQPTGRPDSANPLKRKGDEGSDGSDKRQNDRDENMRPVAGPSDRQGSSSLEADENEDETKLEYQHDSPSSERIGEATAPQQQSNDQSSISPHLPGSSFPIQQSAQINTPPAIESDTSSQTERPHDPKPTKIPGPKRKAHLKPSQRQERLAIRQDWDPQAVPAQEASPPSIEGPSGYSFNAPKNVASGILPHVRKYTRLSETTNTVLRGRCQPNASTATPPPNLHPTVPIRRSYSGQVGTTRTTTT